MSAHVGKQDVVRPEVPAHVPQDLLRLHGEARIVLLHREVVADGVAEPPPLADVEQGQPALVVEAVVERLVDLPERVGDVGLDVEHHGVVAVDLGWIEVDVDDSRRAVVVPEARRVLHEVVADADDEVGFVEREVDVVAALKAHGEQAVRVRHRHRALAHEGIDDPDAGLVGEAAELAGGALPYRAVAGQDNGLSRLGDEIDRLSHYLVVGAGTAGLRGGHRRLIALLLCDVLGKLDEGGAGLLGLRGLERLAHDLGHRARVPDGVRPLGDRGEHGDRVHVLVALLVQAPGAALADDAHHRRAVHVGVGDAGDEIGRSGPESAETYPRLAGQSSVCVGGKGGGLLVPAEHEADGAVHQRDHHVRVLFPRHPEDVGDAFRLQAADEQVGCLHIGIQALDARAIASLLGRPTSSPASRMPSQVTGSTGMPSASRFSMVIRSGSPATRTGSSRFAGGEEVT